jgi:molybdopterin/thiamine biosynthesis adenylyltransferase
MSEVIGPSFLRHSAFVNPSSFPFPIWIIGCGAVGSNLALMLARMGASSFVLVDFDSVEAHNLPNQAFAAKHVGVPKVDALREVLLDFNPQIEVKVYNERFTDVHAAEVGSSVVCLAVDSLDARGLIADAIRVSSEPLLMTDCRMGFEYAQAYLFKPMDSSSYRGWRDTVVSDSQAQDSPCNRQICATLVHVVTAYTAHMICNFVADPGFVPKPVRQFLLDKQFNTV